MNIFSILEEAEKQAEATEKLLAELQAVQQSFNDELSGRMKQLLDRHERNKEQTTSGVVEVVIILTQLAISVENHQPRYFGDYHLKVKPCTTSGYRRFSVQEGGKFMVDSSIEKNPVFDTADAFVRSYATAFDCLGFCQEIFRRVKDLTEIQASAANLLKRDIDACLLALSELVKQS